MGSVSRETVVAALQAALEPLPFVDALVEGGAAAWGRLDPWSDVDLYAFVEDGKTEEAFHAIEGALQTLSPIQHTFAAQWPPASGIHQKFYRLEAAGPFLLVDLAVVTRSAPEKFLEPEIHGDNVVYFDKTGITRIPPLDRDAFHRKLRERLAHLQDGTEMFHAFVEKELNRGNGIEAFDNYRTYVLGPLLEVLRMKHGSLHHSFRARYVHSELPADVVARYRMLLFVSGPDDLRSKYPEALRWFREVARDLR
ncbi:MAG TPA: hypothetical protein VJ400_01025 [Thermoplasmata archaeon]|nr:hypothetical protein [Thermoplasmata archaeon]